MPKKNKGLQPGSPIPAFELEGVDGKRYSNTDFEGKPLLLFFLRSTM